MNRKILQKAIDSIKAEKYEYAMGILETVLEGLPEEKANAMSFREAASPGVISEMRTIPNTKIDDPESKAINSLASARLSEVLKASQIDEIN